MGGTVLCVDNDRNLCEILAKALRSEGYRVATAHDGDAALASLERVQPDLVLLDLILPKRDGFAVLEALRGGPAPRSRVPVVLISGCSPTPEYQRRAETLGAAALLRKPVSLENLLTVVASELGQPARSAPPNTAAVRAAKAQDEAGLSGDFAQLPFAALLHHLHGLRATGVLHLSSERKRKWLRLRDGYPIAVRSNLVNECLGNHLVRAGRITASELAESRRRMKGGQLQGEILVAMDLLSEDEIASALRAQAEEKLFEIFSWPNGEFRFESGGNLQRANDLSLERSPANLILEGVRTRLPLERIDSYLASHSHCMLRLAESPFYRFQEVDLDPAQLELVRGLAQPVRIAEFIGAEENLRRTLYALIAAGMLEADGEVAARKPKTAPPAKLAAPAAPRQARVKPLREVVRQQPSEDTKSVELATLAQRFRGQNPFQILDVPESADEQQVQAAYGRLCESTHPDRVSHASDAVKVLAAEVFALVANAYETLVDPRRRQGYLLGLKKADREAAEREVGKRALEAEMQFQQGDAALRARDYSAALRCFGRALELYPDEGEYHAHYGWTLHLAHPDNTAMASEAMEHVQRALKLAPDREKPYLFMGRLCKAIGRADVAEKMFARALKIQPECLDALRELRLINMRREKGKGLIGRLLRR
jgi:CheY-like chemotaxis protein/DnaJ-domain-containing protein 1